MAFSTAGWSWPFGAFAHTIEARNGGIIDLQGVQTITGPGQDDRLEINVKTGGNIDLTSLRSVSASGNGWVDFSVSDATTLLLPSIEDLSAVRFFAFTAGRTRATGVAPASYTPGGLPPTALMTADGAGSELDLRALTSISDAGWSWPFGAFPHSIEARNEGFIDLGGVQTITGPTQEDRLEINVQSGGSIDLTSLRSVSASGNGSVDFNVSDSTTLLLPSVEDLSAVRFTAVTGARTRAAGVAPASYTPGGLPPTALMLADGAGSELDLRALTSISDAGWSWPFGAFPHTIEARNGGLIDLRGVQTITGPAQDERLEISAVGGVINLSGLSTIAYGGVDGRVNLAISDGGLIKAGGVEIETGMTITIADAGSRLRLLGTALASAGPGVAINLTTAGTRLEAGGSLLLGTYPPPPPPVPPTITLTTVAGATITVGQDFFYTHTNLANLVLDKATVHFNGSGVQHCEVGGQDLGPNGPCLLGDGNFGFGQLVVGEAGRATTLRLSDRVDNGRRSGRAEALYLWGSFDRGSPPTVPCGPTSPQVNGLRIQGGSTLYLDHVNVYAFQNGAWEHINCRFDGTIRRVAYDGGFIETFTCYANCDGSTEPPIVNVSDYICFLNRFNEGNCSANCDGSTTPPILNVSDFVCFMQKAAAMEGCM